MLYIRYFYNVLWLFDWHKNILINLWWANNDPGLIFKSVFFFLGMHNQPLLITDNHLLLTADTDNNFTFFEPEVFAPLRINCLHGVELHRQQLYTMLLFFCSQTLKVHTATYRMQLLRFSSQLKQFGFVSSPIIFLYLLTTNNAHLTLTDDRACLISL